MLASPLKSMNKVYNGTRSDNKQLCLTCRKASVMKGAAEGQEMIYCNEVSEFLKLRVVECSKYDDKNLPSIHDLRETAWILCTTNKNTIGFIRVEEYRKLTQGYRILPDKYDD